jgi:hypothetical protein
MLCLFYNERKNKSSSQTRETIEQELASVNTRQPEIQRMIEPRDDFSPQSDTTVSTMPTSNLETMLHNQDHIPPGFIYHPTAPHLRWSNGYDKVAVSQPLAALDMAQKAIRFVDSPARPLRLDSRAQSGAELPVIPFRLDTRTNSGAVARSAPSPTFGKVDTNFSGYMPGTPKRLF